MSHILNDIKNFGYKANEVYIEKYYKFPSFLMTNESYSSISDSSKITYMLFKNEFRRALHEKWIDENGMLYLQFTQQKLMQLLNCYQGKVTKIINELESHNLIAVVKGEFDIKKKKNEKNKYYLLQPNITAEDLFIKDNNESEYKNSEDYIDSLEPSRDAIFASRDNSPETLDNNGNAKIASRNNCAETLDNSGNAKIAQHYYINNNLDTNRHLIDTEQDQQQDRILLDSFVEIMKDESIATFIPERVLGLIKAFSSSYAEAQQTVRTIHNAKNKAQKETGQVVAFEELVHYGVNPDAGLYNTLIKAYQKQKTEQVENIQNLIFVYVKNWFIEKPIAYKQQLSQSTELPKVSLVDWSRSEN